MTLGYFNTPHPKLPSNYHICNFCNAGCGKEVLRFSKNCSENAGYFRFVEKQFLGTIKLIYNKKFSDFKRNKGKNIFVVTKPKLRYTKISKNYLFSSSKVTVAKIL